MAACYKLACNRCDYAIEIWDEGNPYAQDWRGRRWFIYHPHLFEGVVHEYERHEGRFVSQEEKEQLLRHSGNASEHVCLTCGRIIPIAQPKFTKTSMPDNPLLKVPPASRGNRTHAPHAVPLAKRGEPAGGGQL